MALRGELVERLAAAKREGDCARYRRLRRMQRRQQPDQPPSPGAT
jgi:hypothetical protein